MKKYLFTLLAVIGLLASCTNDDIEVIKSAPVQIKISLSDFYQSYTYNDTKHNYMVADSFRVFHSEKGKYIKVCSYFYNKANGELVDSIVKYSTNTNDVVESLDLNNGTYTVVTSLCFADGTSASESWWNIADRNNLSTARLVPFTRFSKWNILSEEEKTLTVEYGKTATLVTTPKPVGSLIYIYYQNFQYKNQQTYPTVGDNNIRLLALYSQKIAQDYRVDPNGTSRFDYMEDPGGSDWYYMSYPAIPTKINPTYTHFEKNVYDFCYALANEFNMTFGYVLDGEKGFQPYGQADRNTENGQIYLAYWDWFQVGNPYFGKADNNHWHTYSISAAKGKNESVPNVKPSIDISVNKIVR